MIIAAVILVGIVFYFSSRSVRIFFFLALRRKTGFSAVYLSIEGMPTANSSLVSGALGSANTIIWFGITG
jgi:acid phosphatase family membrane protein YuiD